MSDDDLKEFRFSPDRTNAGIRYMLEHHAEKAFKKKDRALAAAFAQAAGLYAVATAMDHLFDNETLEVALQQNTDAPLVVKLEKADE